MSVIGSQPGFNSWAWYGGGAANQVAAGPFTMPVAGWVTSVSFYANSNSGTTNFTGVVWDSSGNVLGTTTTNGIGSGSESVNGQSWINLGCGFYLPAGKQFYVGWWRTPGGSMLYSTGAGTSYLGANKPSSAGALGGLSGIGAVGAYLTYTAIPAPSATTGAAPSGANLTTTTAVLSGTVNDNGANADGAGGSTWNLYVSPNSNGAGSTLVASGGFTAGATPSATATGLTPNSAYWYAIQATNAIGTTTGAWVGFTTPNVVAPAPSATTGAAPTGGNLTQTTALLTSSLNDNGCAADGGGVTTYGFYVATSSTGGGSVYQGGGTFTGTAAPSFNATGLTASTNYWYQVTVSNTSGNGAGAWVPFTTATVVVPLSTTPSVTLQSPANAATLRIDLGGVMAWTFVAPAGLPADVQVSYYLRDKLPAGTYRWWNGSAFTSAQAGATGGVEVAVTSAAASITLPSGLFTSGDVHSWSVQVVGGSGLLSGYSAAWTFTVGTAPGLPTLTQSYDPVLNQTLLTLTGLSTATTGSIEFSDDGGVTWLFARGATQLTCYPTAATVYDLEQSPMATRQYRARIWTGTPPNYSLYQTTAGTSIAPMTTLGLQSYWLRDPVGGTSLQVLVKPASINSTVVETFTRHKPLGSPVSVFVSDVEMGDDFAVVLATANPTDQAALDAMLRLTRPLFWQSPVDAPRWLRRIASDTADVAVDDAPWLTYHEHTVTFAAVARPNP